MQAVVAVACALTKFLSNDAQALRLPRLFAPPSLPSTLVLDRLKKLLVEPTTTHLYLSLKLTFSHSLSPSTTMSSSSKNEGEGVAPQNKGSWATFLKVRNPPGKEPRRLADSLSSR